jgi:hypothetical protein
MDRQYGLRHNKVIVKVKVYEVGYVIVRYRLFCLFVVFIDLFMKRNGDRQTDRQAGRQTDRQAE